MVTRFFVDFLSGPEAHPVSCTVVIEPLAGLTGRGVVRLSSAQIANGLGLYLHHPSVLIQACPGVTFTFTV